MGATPGTTLTVRQYAGTVGEVQAFRLLLTKCKFCKAAQYAIDQYKEFSARYITGFTFSDHTGDLLPTFSFYVYFDGAPGV